jgi:putative endonuclease
MGWSPASPKDTLSSVSSISQREHNIKHWSRKWKVRLILADNPDWNDLYDSVTQ